MNTSELRQKAQAKREEAFAKVDEGIETLPREKQKRTINFNQVAQVFGVSKA